MEKFRHLHNWKEECDEPHVPVDHSLDYLASLISCQPPSWRILEQIPALTSGHRKHCCVGCSSQTVPSSSQSSFLGLREFR